MKLYVIGNGFDVHHELDTKYTSFGLYLKNHYPDVYEVLLEHYGFGELEPKSPSSMSDPLWSEFETNLSNLDTESVLEAHIESMPCYADPNFRDRDRYIFRTDMEQILELLTNKLYKAFKEFILAVKFPPLNDKKLIRLDRNATFLTFNYTDTLAKYYGVHDQNVLFIHNKAKEESEKLVLGHGIDPTAFEDKPIKPPEGLNDEEHEEWIQFQSDKYDYSFEIGKDEINKYFRKTFKGTHEIIERNEKFFSSLGNIDEVYVIGHSLSNVDLPYFSKLINSVKTDAKWIVTFYSPEDKQRHFNTLNGLGISNISVVRIEEV